MSYPIKEVFVVRFGHFGDVLLATGVLRFLGETRGYRFTVLTKQAWAPVFTGHPFVDTILTYEECCGSQSDIRCFRFLAKEYAQMPLLDLHGNARSGLLRFFWRAKTYKYHKMSLERRVFVASRGRFYGELLRELSVPQRYAATFFNTPVPLAQDLLPELWLSGVEKVWAKKTIASLGPLPVAIHPFASHASKTWPSSVWHEFVKLLEEQNIPWVVLGRGEELFANDNRSFVNKLSIRESAAILSECRVLVTGDSGPMHLASAVKTPVIALFGPTTCEWGFYPQGLKDQVLELPLPCRPCSLHGKGKCPRLGECLMKITPHNVLDVLPIS